jgi:hypothetical protein
MRLSEISTDRAADVLCEVSVYLANIATDEELSEELKHKIDNIDTKTRAEIFALGVEKVTVLMPIILKKHKNDVFGVLAVLNNTTIDVIANQNIMITMAQVKEAVQDRELVDFFKSCVSEEMK